MRDLSVRPHPSAHTKTATAGPPAAHNKSGLGPLLGLPVPFHPILIHVLACPVSLPLALFLVLSWRCCHCHRYLITLGKVPKVGGEAVRAECLALGVVCLTTPHLKVTYRTYEYLPYLTSLLDGFIR